MVEMEVKRAINCSERERERRVVGLGRLCKFFFTAGWRVNNGKMEGGVDARVGMARGRIG